MRRGHALSTQSENHILASLPTEDYQRLSPHLEFVELQHGQILYQAGGIIDYVYFPSNAMVSLISQLSDGSSVEVGIAGYEGIVGISAVPGVNRSPHEMLVQVPDGGMRLEAGVL
jgi:CRP-like cAMP-binding protein